MDNLPTQPRQSDRRYSNAALTAVALLLGLNLLNNLGNSGNAAFAQSGPEDGLVSAAEQRKTIIAELRTLGGRMQAVESALSHPLTVKVVEMPPVKLADPNQKPAAENRKAAR
jgi:hypothetical protein